MNDGLEATHIRNDWFRDRYSFVLKIAAGAILVAVLEAVAIIVLFMTRPDPKYFAVSPEGNVTKLVPVDQPLLTSQALGQWASETARLAYAIDFARYQEQMMALRDRFSDSAYKGYLAQMASSGNLDQIKKSRLVVDAQSRPAVIIGSRIENGRYTWTVEVPLTVVTHFGNASQRSQNMVVQMDIVRVDNRFRPESGVVVNRFVVQIT